MDDRSGDGRPPDLECRFTAPDLVGSDVDCLIRWNAFSQFITTRLRYTGPQPGTKSGRRSGDKPLINRGSTGRLIPPSSCDLNRISFVRNELQEVV